MNSERFAGLVCVVLGLVAVMMTGPVLAQEAADADSELAKKTQNPVAELISVPFQNNINFEVGDGSYTQNILNIQPVYPVQLNDEWNVITRTIVPLVHQPPLIPGTDREFGLGDVQFTAFLSPRDSGGLIWGAGPVFRFDTATDETLGQEKWSAGPSFVALTMNGPWVYGALVQNVTIEGSKSGLGGLAGGVVGFAVGGTIGGGSGKGVAWAAASKEKGD